MNRRRFINLSSQTALSLAVLSPTILACKQSQPQQNELFLTKVNSGHLKSVQGSVSRFNNKGGTVGILETADGFVVIDAQFPDSIKPLLKAIANIEGKPIQYLCNTHHHADHTAGNIEFKKLNCITIAQTEVPKYQKIRAQEKNEEKKQFYATTLFNDKYSFKSDLQHVKAYHYGAGHTYGDAMYHFEQDDVVHLGDLVFNKVLPVFRVNDGADALNWARILDKVIDQFDNKTRYIFGHADNNQNTVGDKSDVIDMRNFMVAVNEFAEKEIVQNKKSLTQLTNQFQFIPGYEKRKPLWDGHWEEFLSNLIEYTTIK